MKDSQYTKNIFVTSNQYGKDNWDVWSSDFVGAYRTTPHTVTKETPAFLMFERQFKVSPTLEFQAPVKQYNEDFLSERIHNLQEAYQIVRILNRKKKKKSGLDASHWLGPYDIVEVISEQNVKAENE